MPPWRSCLTLAALLMPLAAWGAELSADDIVVTQAGEYVGAETGMRQPAPETGEGSVRGLGRWVFARSARTICAARGVSFGVEYHLARPATAEADAIQVVAEHPPMHVPDGRILTHERYDAELAAGNSIAGFSFDNDYELVPGAWTIALMQHGRLLARTQFQVVTGCVPVQS